MPWKFGDDNRRMADLPSPVDEHGVLTCPACGCQHFDVTHTRKWINGTKRRRRECSHCKWSITTEETVVLDQ